MGWLEDSINHVATHSPQEAVPLYPPKVPGRTLLVDGDMVSYSNAGNDDTPPGNARLSAIARIENLRDMSGCEKVVVHLTDNASTKGDRYIIATVKPYQDHRKSGRKPKNWAYLRDWMQSYCGDLFTVKTWGTREADDGIAYHATVLGVDKAVIATADKDMRMIPAWHIDWSTYQLTRLDNEFRVWGDNGKLYGHAWFWQQVLQGDAADNIPGLPKYMDGGKPKLIGEKTAEKFLSQVNCDLDASGVVAALYASYYPDDWADRLAEQMALLWMRRDRHAAVDDWLGWFFYEPDDPLHRAMFEASQRLVERVELAKRELPWNA